MVILSSVLEAAETVHMDGRMISDCGFDEFQIEVLGTSFGLWGTWSPCSMRAEAGTFVFKCSIFPGGDLLGYEVIEDVNLPAETRTNDPGTLTFTDRPGDTGPYDIPDRPSVHWILSRSSFIDILQRIVY